MAIESLVQTFKLHARYNNHFLNPRGIWKNVHLVLDGEIVHISKIDPSALTSDQLIETIRVIIDRLEELIP